MNKAYGTGPKCSTTHYGCDCVLEQLQAADKLAKAAIQADTALSHCEHSQTGEHLKDCEKCYLWKALTAYESARGKQI